MAIHIGNEELGGGGITHGKDEKCIQILAGKPK
jgi:hypothetical protein